MVTDIEIRLDISNNNFMNLILNISIKKHISLKHIINTCSVSGTFKIRLENSVCAQ